MRFDLPILFASAVLFVGAGAAVAHKAPCDSGSCSGKHRDDGDDVSLEEEHDGSSLGSMSFGDDDLENHGLGKKKKGLGGEDSDHKNHKNRNGKNRDDEVIAKGDDDDHFDHGDHKVGKRDRPAGGVPVPEPSVGLLLAAPLLALGLRSRCGLRRRCQRGAS